MLDCFRSLRLFVACAIPLFGATPMQAKAITLEESLQGMQACCMSDVCLGMTADGVEKLAGSKLRMWSEFSDTRSCGKFGKEAAATFTDRSGQDFNVNFRDYPGSASPRMRYRVSSVALYVQASEAEFDGLRNTLTSRYALNPSNLWKKADQLDEWSKKASIGSVVVQASYQRKNALLILAQFDPDYPGRFGEQEGCKSRLPKI
jgi:hypothetical protein